jgi:hypothetical protein
MLGFGQENVKSLETPFDYSKSSSDISMSGFKPLPYESNDISSKYSFLDSQQSTYNKSDNNNETNLQYIIPVTIGAGMLLFIVSRKK